MRVSLLVVLLLGLSTSGVFGQYYVDYPTEFEIMDALHQGQLANQFNFGGIGQQPVQQQQQQQFSPLVAGSMAQGSKKVQYTQPVVTFAQPIVQQANLGAPQVQKLQYNAQPIVQPTFQTAPLQMVQAISATAPTIQKQFHGNLASTMQSVGYSGAIGNPQLNQVGISQQQALGQIGQIGSLGVSGWNQQQIQPKQQVIPKSHLRSRLGLGQIPQQRVISQTQQNPLHQQLLQTPVSQQQQQFPSQLGIGSDQFEQTEELQQPITNVPQVGGSSDLVD